MSPAALVATDDLDTQRSAAFLPDEPGLLLGGFAGEIGGVLLGAYARSRSREARTETPEDWFTSGLCRAASSRAAGYRLAGASR